MEGSGFWRTGYSIASQGPQALPAWKGVVLLQLRILQSIKKKASFLEGRDPGQLEGESLTHSWAAEVVLKWQ